MVKKNGRIVRICNDLIELLDKIGEEEKKRGIDDISYYDKSAILSKRILNAGGLKPCN